MNRGDVKLVTDRCIAHDVPDAADMIEALHIQLAAAIAACKLKDDALQHLLCDVGQSNSMLGAVEARKALAIQPDDSALKAWLGEPRSYLYKFNSEFGDGTFWSHRPTHNGNAALESLPLYKPKELK